MRRAVAALAGAAATTVVLRTRAARADSWKRTNFRGRTVSLTGGVAAAAGATCAAACAPAGRNGVAAALATAGAAVFGLVDDRAADPAAARGLRGHLRALARGELTTGAVKLFGIPALSVAAAAFLDRENRSGDRPASSLTARGLDALASGALIAGAANLVNLFDLRPGRALKATGLLAAPLALLPGPAGQLAAGACGVVAAGWRDDLGERTMLGDTGANALGALVGAALALVPSAAVRTGALAGVVTLVVASEKVSFSAVIDRVPLARAVDRWGRLP